MRNSRRLAVAAGAVIATGSLIAGTAGVAGAAEAYTASAKADALTISVFGQTITTSASEAALDPAKAFAKVTETLLQGGSAEVTSTNASEESSASVQECSGQELTQIPLVNRADVTCGTAKARLGQFARAEGAEVVLEISVANLLATLGLQEPATGATGQIFGGLDQLIAPIAGTPLGDLVDPATATVQDVLDQVLTLDATVRIAIAPTLAEATKNGTKITSHARAQGIRIELLPPDLEEGASPLFPDLANGEPLLTIIVGAAEAQKTIGGAPGDTFAKSSLVTIKLGSTKLTEALGLSSDDTTIEIEGGQSFCLLPDPLTTCVTVAAAGVDAEGNPAADGASIQLFKGAATQGGIDIATGRASTGGAIQPGELAVPADVPRELPRTGGPATLPLIGGGLLAAAAAARRFSLRRR